MKISVFGLGYVGTVTCGCFAREGHEVLGVDISPVKLEMIQHGTSPVVEQDLPDLVQEQVRSGRLRATAEVAEAVRQTDISFICVGTPPRPNGSLDLTHVERVCAEIGTSLRSKSSYHVIVCRSTMLPGSTREVVIPQLERHSGKVAGMDFGVCFNPEFLREGTSVYDFYNPPKTVMSGTDERSVGLLEELYRELPGEKIVAPIEVAEMVKYADNAFHAVKITFANEIGAICKKMAIDSHMVMDIFCKDTKLNLSPYYLKPGFAFGGSCLPKDVSALTYKARSLDLPSPLLNSLMVSNKAQIEAATDLVLSYGKKRIGILGFSFKAGTDDLRGSPLVMLIETLIGKGCELRLYDRNVKVARLLGANQSYVEQHVPHLASLMAETPEQVIDASQIIIVGNRSEEFRAIVARIPPTKQIVDLVRINTSMVSSGHYTGIAW